MARMNTILKDDRGKFAKGVSGNPQGRKKGSLNKRSAKYANIFNLAGEKSEEAFQLLWEAVQAKEGWAHQLYFKELVPKCLKQKTAFLEPVGTSVNEQIKSLSDALITFDELTEDEILTRLKTLAALRVTESIDNHTNEVKETKKTLEEKVALFNKVIELKEKEHE